MFGFLKELVAAAKEGIDEAKQEYAEEQAVAAERERFDRQTRAATLRARMEAAEDEEMFAVALGAVYRQVFLDELGTAAKQQRPPAYLYLPALPDEEVGVVGKLLRRDFGVHDEESVVDVCCVMDQGLTLDEETDALLIARSCWLITAATGAGLLDPNRMLELTQTFVLDAERTYDSWTDYGRRFLAGERRAPGSNPIGRKQLARTVDTLLTTPGSPWHDRPFPQRVGP